MGTSHPLAPIAIGAILVSVVYAGASTSGAHYNPAVTIGVSMRRALAWWNARLLVHPLVSIGYILAQVSAAGIGALPTQRAAIERTKRALISRGLASTINLQG